MSPKEILRRLSLSVTKELSHSWTPTGLPAPGGPLAPPPRTRLVPQVFSSRPCKWSPASPSPRIPRAVGGARGRRSRAGESSLVSPRASRASQPSKGPSSRGVAEPRRAESAEAPAAREPVSSQHAGSNPPRPSRPRGSLAGRSPARHAAAARPARVGARHRPCYPFSPRYWPPPARCRRRAAGPRMRPALLGRPQMLRPTLPSPANTPPRVC